MSKFFSELVCKNLINEWAEILDWLFDDKKFDDTIWSSGYVGSFTKRLKKLDYIGDNNYEYLARKDIIFPTKFDKKNPVIIKMVNGNGEGKDIVRHIRNGIAHGHCEFQYVKGIEYIEITDYNNKNQTAYISLPITHILLLHKIYSEIEQRIKSNYKKDNKNKYKKYNRIA